MSDWGAPDQPGREQQAPPPMRVTLPPHLARVPPPYGGTVRTPSGLMPSGPPRPIYREPLPVRLGPAAAGAASAALWMLLFGLLATTARSYAWLSFGAGAAAWLCAAVLARFGDRGVAVGVAVSAAVGVAVAGVVV